MKSLFQTVGAQHENRRAAMSVDENCVDSKGLTWMTSEHATVYGEYEGCCSLTAL